MERKQTAFRKVKSLALVTAGSSLFFAGLNIYKGNQKFYENILMPINTFIPPEISHRLAIYACKYNIFPFQKNADDKRLQVNLLNFQLSNPIGLAAGFDKHGEVPDKLMKLGFANVEIGSVTPLPQSGNEKPRVFRLIEDQAIINRYGFNSDGHEIVLNRLKMIREKKQISGLLGVSLGKNKTSNDFVDDYVKGMKNFEKIADYLVVNVSSPNTPGLRNIQHKEILYNLLKTIKSARAGCEKKPPIFLKLSPDLTEEEINDVADILSRKECKIDGLVISNTTTERKDLKSTNAIEKGGLSGAPLTNKSTKMIAKMYKLTKGSIPIIGVGGIFNGKDAFDKITAGATIVQIYTSFAYYGPFVVPKIKKELCELLTENGYKSVNDAIGKESDKFLK